MGRVSRRGFTHHVGAVPRFYVAITSARAEITEHPLGKRRAAIGLKEALFAWQNQGLRR